MSTNDIDCLDVRWTLVIILILNVRRRGHFLEMLISND